MTLSLLQQFIKKVTRVLYWTTLPECDDGEYDAVTQALMPKASTPTSKSTPVKIIKSVPPPMVSSDPIGLCIPLCVDYVIE